MKAKNYTKKYGLLTPLYITDQRDKYGRAIWKVKCDCGNTQLLSTGTFTRNKSCGCLRKLSAEQAALNAILRTYKRHAQNRKLKWGLTNKQYKDLLYNNCYYCGVVPSNQYKPRYHKTIFKYNGIDRIDNTKGYIITNVVSCCLTCNRMKFQSTKDEFIQHCHLISERHK